jgi:clan AA aspartic protease (TIGR02281 family)
MQVLDDSIEQICEQAEQISPAPKGKKGKKAPPSSDDPRLQQLYTKYVQIDAKRKEKQLQIQKLGDARGDYVTLLNETADKWEAALRRYKTLSADALTTTALASINKTAAPPLKLGPTVKLTQELGHLREEQQAMSGVVVKFPPGSHVAELDVTLNGVWITPMICDSGASYVSLSWECAKAAGLSPTPNDPTVTMTLADGKKVECKKMVLKSVQVGRFLVQNVDCVVDPAGMKDSPQLLGTSFLRYFDYRMDLGAGELYLAPFGAKEVTVAGPPIDAKRAKLQPAAKIPGSGAVPKTESPQASPAPAGSSPVIAEAWTDLLKIAAFPKDARGSHWTREGEDVIYRAPPGMRSWCQTNRIADGSYDLHVELTRLTKDGAGPGIMFPVGMSSGGLIFGSTDDGLIGLARIDGKEYTDGPATCQRATALPVGHATSIDIRVLIQGQSADISVVQDGTKILQWKGLQSAITRRGDASMLSAITLRCDRDVRFSSLRVHPLSGQLREFHTRESEPPEKLTSAPPATVSPKPATTRPSSGPNLFDVP